jgi:quercetin dioxygenase-like cupin family protein
MRMLVRHIWDAQEDKKQQPERVLFSRETTETVALGRVTVKPGKSTQTALHTDEEEICLILKGRALLTVGNELQEVRAGDAAYIPRNTRHQLACISDENLEYLYFANWPKP